MLDKQQGEWDVEEVIGFSRNQRKWILNAFGNQCGFHSKVNGKWVRCKAKRKLQVHHIHPRGWCRVNMRPTFNVNGMHNAIPLCVTHHEMVHPDVIKARASYRQGNKNAFAEMSGIRAKLNWQGIPYWDTTWDLMFLRVNARFIGKYTASNKANKYPGHKIRGLNGRVKA